MVLCDVCNHAIWKYPVWDCSRYFSIITGNVRPVASGTSRDTADRCHRLRSHLQVVVELMICSEETCGPFLKSCQICIFGLSGGEPLGGADGGGQGRTPSALYLCVWMSNSFPLAFRSTTEPQVRAKTIRMVSFWR